MPSFSSSGIGLIKLRGLFWKGLDRWFQVVRLGS